MQIVNPLRIPAQDRDLARLLALKKAVARDGRGQIVFLVGDNGSGRSLLLRRLQNSVSSANGRETVLAGGFRPDGYVAWEDVAPSAKLESLLRTIVSVGQPAATVAGGVLPFAGFIGQVLSRSAAALQLAETFAGEKGRPDLSTLMPKILRRLCEDQGPVICMVDDADCASDGWWMDLVFLFARRVVRDLPLLLVLAVNGPRELGTPQEGEAEALTVARQLTLEGLAHWHPLEAVTAHDLQHWIGPIAHDVGQALLDITAGRAGWIAQLWEDWRQRDIVTQGATDDCWHFSAKRALVLGDVEDVLGGRLRESIGTGGAQAIERARQLLCCAALEGPRFTAEAVAAALGRSRDEINDELDESFIYDDQHLNGLLEESGQLSIVDEIGTRTIWLYRFRSQLDWLTLHHHGHTDAKEHRELSLSLAKALQASYGRESHRVAPTLARLYKAAGDDEAAQQYRRMGMIGVNRGLILWRANTALASAEPESSTERTRVVTILLAAASELFHSGPFPDGFAYASAAQRLAASSADRAMALFYGGVSQGHLGDDSRALRELLAALDQFQNLNDRFGQALVRNSLAVMSYRHGDYDKAQQEHNAVLDIRRELGDRSGEAYTRHALASIHYQHGDYDKAQDEYNAALQTRRELGDRSGEAETRHALANIHYQHGDYDTAQDEYNAALQTHRELGNRYGEAHTRHALANIHYQHGDYDTAQQEHNAVLDIRRELGDRYGEAYSRHALASIHYQHGDYDKAQDEYNAALQTHRELGDRHGEASTRHALANIHYQHGDIDKAQDEYNAALQIRRELGDRHGEAETRHALGLLDY